MYRDFAILKRPDDYKRPGPPRSARDWRIERERRERGEIVGPMPPRHYNFTMLMKETYAAEKSEAAMDSLRDAKDAIGEAVGNLFKF